MPEHQFLRELRDDRRAEPALQVVHRPRATTTASRRASSCATCSKTPAGTRRTRRIRPRSRRAASRRSSISRRWSRDLTGMEVAKASLLDEATAAAEAMTMLHRVQGRRIESVVGPAQFFVADSCFPQTIDVLRARAEPLGIELVVGDSEPDRVRRPDVRRARADAGRSRPRARSARLHRARAGGRRARRGRRPIC